MKTKKQETENLSEQLFKIQSAQMAVWKKRLNRECYEDLEAWVVKKNIALHSGQAFRIKHGTDLDMFVENWEPKITEEVDKSQTYPSRVEIVETVIKAIQYLAPSVIYEIAREALTGTFDGVDDDKIVPDPGETLSDLVFMECWRVEKGNNGPIAFLRMMPVEATDLIERLLTDEIL